MTGARRLFDVAIARFRLHLVAYLVVAAIVFILVAVTRAHGLLWIPLTWAIPLLVHYLIYKARTVDDTWVEQRIEELDLKSYDRDHIESIRATQNRTEPSDVPRQR